jgi:hypothetical protein
MARLVVKGSDKAYTTGISILGHLGENALEYTYVNQ